MARILIIDDNDQFCTMLQKRLELEGYEARSANDGDKGLEMLRHDPVDLVITDMIMPEKEGISTIVEIRRDFPKVKVIAISGGGTVSPGSYLDTAKLLGAARTFSKPMDMSEFLSAVCEVLDEES